MSDPAFGAVGRGTERPPPDEALRVALSDDRRRDVEPPSDRQSALTVGANRRSLPADRTFVRAVCRPQFRQDAAP
jgi:hypothetical protein